jgi:hypothetical protein
MASAQTARSGGLGDDPLLLCLGIKFAMDSLLEGNGFELPVPRAIRLRFRDFALARLR